MKVTGTISAVLKSKPAQIWKVPPESTVFDAIALMSDANIGAVLVMEGEKLIGVFTERDYTRKIVLKGKSSRETSVREVLTPSVVTVTPWDTVEEAMALMTEHRIRHLPVMESGRVTGVISMGELVKWTISAQTAAIDQLTSYVLGPE